MRLVLLVVGFLFAGLAQADVVEFRIADGTGDGSWNTAEEMIEVVVGDTLRIFNDDSVNHRLHTFGSPCNHGPNIPAGASWDCEIERTWEADVDGPLYDHYRGPSAEVWINAVEE